ncbi:DUF2809 domain-containing protein [Streptomyces sp. GD-15H]|uniref:DUF2809 domain-containing protein n=1 Tax=Streptomyces sp. GD-15H TaxID=3129112 RepID=UPI003249D7F4
MGLLTRTRLIACAAALLTLAAGLGSRAVMTGDIAKYAGDALYTALVHVLVVLVAPWVKPTAAAGAALGFSCAVELFQLTGIPGELAVHSLAAKRGCQFLCVCRGARSCRSGPRGGYFR